MMYMLTPPEPRWETLIPGRKGHDAVEVLFPALPSAKAVRKAREAQQGFMASLEPSLRVAFVDASAAIRSKNAEAIRAIPAIVMDAFTDAGEVFSAELVRWSILDWRGVGDLSGQAVKPTQDRFLPGQDGAPATVVLGTITAFLTEPDMMDAADRLFVLPFVVRDAEKNGLSAGPDGTGPAETPAADTASPPATPDGRTDAACAPTANTNCKPKRAKRSGR